MMQYTCVEKERRAACAASKPFKGVSSVRWTVLIRGCVVGRVRVAVLGRGAGTRSVGGTLQRTTEGGNCELWRRSWYHSSPVGVCNSSRRQANCSHT